MKDEIKFEHAWEKDKIEVEWDGLGNQSKIDTMETNILNIRKRQALHRLLQDVILYAQKDPTAKVAQTMIEVDKDGGGAMGVIIKSLLKD
jgi:hypothetical protein